MKALIIGGDLRKKYLALGLAEHFDEVYQYGLEKAKIEGIPEISDLRELGGFDVIVLPLPVTLDSLNLNTPLSDKVVKLCDVFSNISSKTLVFGGMPDESAKKMAGDCKIEIIDYFAREELTVLNAIPTAQGALEIAMKERACTVYESECLITGAGRISKLLQRYLTVLGAKVTVAARRREDLVWAKIGGCEAVHIDELGEKCKTADIIFNTVPQVLFTKQMLGNIKPDALVIDLASKPGGVDFSYAAELGLNVVWALSLPGKIAPISSGLFIRDTILGIQSEMDR